MQIFVSRWRCLLKFEVIALEVKNKRIKRFNLQHRLSRGGWGNGGGGVEHWIITMHISLSPVVPLIIQAHIFTNFLAASFSLFPGRFSCSIDAPTT